MCPDKCEQIVPLGTQPTGKSEKAWREFGEVTRLAMATKVS